MKRLTGSSPQFFATQAALRKWFAAHHRSADELWIGFYRKDSGRATVTYHQALDEALCVGWIDGVRKRLDEISYVQRFTPRRKRSVWSAVNMKRVGELRKAGRMKAAGLAVFEARDPARAGLYSYERQVAGFTSAQEQRFKADPEAWAFFQAQPPGYRRLMAFWVTSAKREDTRERRLTTLIEQSRQRKRIQ